MLFFVVLSLFSLVLWLIARNFIFFITLLLLLFLISNTEFRVIMLFLLFCLFFFSLVWLYVLLYILRRKEKNSLSLSTPQLSAFCIYFPPLLFNVSFTPPFLTLNFPYYLLHIIYFWFISPSSHLSLVPIPFVSLLSLSLSVIFSFYFSRKNTTSPFFPPSPHSLPTSLSSLWSRYDRESDLFSRDGGLGARKGRVGG